MTTLNKYQINLTHNAGFRNDYGLSSALVVSQILYWTKKNQGVVREGKRWIYLTAEELGNQIDLSVRQIRRCIKKLKNDGIILVRNFNKWSRVNYYSLNMDIWNKITRSVLKESPNEMSPSPCHDVTFHTTEITYIDNISKDIMEKPSLPNIPPLESKNQVAVKMLDYWNTTFAKSSRKMNSYVEKDLLEAYVNHFQSSFENWKHYCDKVSTSVFLTGDKFTLHLSWVLKSSTIERIKNNELGVKDIPVPVAPLTELKGKSVAHIESIQEDPLCKNFRLAVLDKVGAPTYLSWFKDLKFFSRENGLVDHEAPNDFIRDSITQRFGHVLAKLRDDFISKL